MKAGSDQTVNQAKAETRTARGHFFIIKAAAIVTDSHPGISWPPLDLHLDLSFIGKRKCRVRVTDLGLGNLYPASGKRWDAVITFAAEKTPGKEGEA